MISKILSRTASSFKQANVLKNSFVYKPQYNFFFTSSDCYSVLKVGKNASKEEINAAYHQQLRTIQSQSRSSRQEKDISELRSAFEEAMRNLNKRQSSEESSTFSSHNDSQRYNQQSDNQGSSNDQNQQFQDNNNNASQKKRGFFKEFLLSQSYGQKPNSEQKQWGMELFVFGILGITGLCYVIGSNLKDHSKHNQNLGPRVILTHTDLEKAKQNYQQYQEYKKIQQETQQQQQQMQQAEHDQQLNSDQNNMDGYFRDTSNNNSSFDKEFEEYKKKNSSSGFFGGSKDN